MRGILEKTFCFARKMAKRESESSEQVSTKDTRLAVSVILEKVCCSLEASCSNHSFNTEGYFQGWEYCEVWSCGWVGSVGKTETKTKGY